MRPLIPADTAKFCILVIFSLGILHLTSPPLRGQYSKNDCPPCKVWNQPQEPFKIYGNTYYVGTHGLSSILITSPTGHVLIDGALPESAEQIKNHIAALGFRIEDVKFILNSHVHFDHAGGIAELQRWSHARVAASQWSAQVLRKGRVARDDPQYGLLPDIAKVKHVDPLVDEEVVHAGNLAITAHLTPGHTPGGTSWTWRSCEGDQCLTVVYADSVTAVSSETYRFSDHPKYVAAFRSSLNLIGNLGCGLLITPHPGASNLIDRLDGKAPLISAGQCRDYARRGRAALNERLAKEQQPSAGE